MHIAAYRPICIDPAFMASAAAWAYVGGLGVVAAPSVVGDQSW